MLQQLQLLKLLPSKSQWWRMMRRESFFYNFCRNGFPREPGTFKGMFSPYFEWVLRRQKWRRAKVDFISVLSNGCMRLICAMQQSLTFNTATLGRFLAVSELEKNSSLAKSLSGGNTEINKEFHFFQPKVLKTFLFKSQVLICCSDSI